MNFQHYINQTPSSSSGGNAKTGTKQSLNSKSKPRIIKFVGNMEDNIKDLIGDMICPEVNKKEFQSILMVFANKIEKLRKERDYYKLSLKEYLISMPHKSSAKKPSAHESATSISGLNICHPIKESSLIENTNPGDKMFDFDLQIFNLKDSSELQSSTLHKQQKIKENNRMQTQVCEGDSGKQQGQMSLRQHSTTVKKSRKQAEYVFVSPVLTCSQQERDKLMREFFKPEQKEDKCSDFDISLNLSEFDEGEKQLSGKADRNCERDFKASAVRNSIMSESNLLDSSSEERLPSNEQKQISLVLDMTKKTDPSEVTAKALISVSRQNEDSTENILGNDEKLKILKQSTDLQGLQVYKNSPSLGAQCTSKQYCQKVSFGRKNANLVGHSGSSPCDGKVLQNSHTLQMKLFNQFKKKEPLKAAEKENYFSTCSRVQPKERLSCKSSDRNVVNSYQTAKTPNKQKVVNRNLYEYQTSKSQKKYSVSSSAVGSQSCVKKQLSQISRYNSTLERLEKYVVSCQNQEGNKLYERAAKRSDSLTRDDLDIIRSVNSCSLNRQEENSYLLAGKTTPIRNFQHRESFTRGQTTALQEKKIHYNVIPR